MAASKNNQYAVKAETDKASAFLQARCKSDEKNAMVRASQAEGLKLTEWMLKYLNQASGYASTNKNPE